MIKWFTGLFQSTDSRVPVEDAYVFVDEISKPLNESKGSFVVPSPVLPPPPPVDRTINWETEQQIIKSDNNYGYRVSPYDAHYIPPPVNNHPFISVPVTFIEHIHGLEYGLPDIIEDVVKPVISEDNLFKPDHYETFNTVNNDSITPILQGEPSIIMNGYGVQLSIDGAIEEGFIDMGYDVSLQPGQKVLIYHAGKYNGLHGLVIGPTNNERRGNNDEILIQSVVN